MLGKCISRRKNKNDPCDLYPCQNDGICIPNIGHHYTCRCNPLWTGINCDSINFL